MGILDVIKNIPTLNEISGSFGEWLAKNFSKTIPGALVLNDVLIDGKEGYTSQIDLIMVGNKGIYVVEVKSFPDAKIYGSTKSRNWKYYKNGKKYEIYSPLMQNKVHIKYLKYFLKDFGDFPVFSVITMICDDYKIQGDLDGKTVICNSLPSMKKGVLKLAKDRQGIFNDDQKLAIFEYIRDNQYHGKAARREHKKKVIEYKKSKGSDFL